MSTTPTDGSTEYWRETARFWVEHRNELEERESAARRLQQEQPPSGIWAFIERWTIGCVTRPKGPRGFQAKTK